MFDVDSLFTTGIMLHLNVNNITVGRLHVSYLHEKDKYVHASRTIILKLKSGDHLKVENALQNGYIRHYLYSGFSGALLY